MGIHWIILLPLLSAPAPTPERPTVLVVVGAAGAPEYGSAFERWAGRWAEAAQRGGAEVVLLGRGESGEGETGKGETGGADKRRLREALAREAKRGREPLWVVLIGHGTFDGKAAKFNLRGADVSADELAGWLEPCRRPLAVVNCASASAPFLNRLSGEGRVVVTATRSGSEVNFARFGDHLSAAVADPAADVDRDGQTSLLEAFLAASQRVADFYKQEGRLATEHALLDDNGDGLGIPADWFEGTRATRAAKDGAPLDGAAAGRWHLLLSPAEAAMGPDARARRDALEAEAEALRAKKASMPEDEYYAALEAVMVRLARVYAEGGEPPATRPTVDGREDAAGPAPSRPESSSPARGDATPADP